MNPRKTRYRFTTSSGTPSFSGENSDDRDKNRSDPDTKHTDAPDTSDDANDDLKHIDQSKGGYGGGSGFSPDRT